jgi:hypothetical protein
MSEVALRTNGESLLASIEAGEFPKSAIIYCALQIIDAAKRLEDLQKRVDELTGPLGPQGAHGPTGPRI